MPRRTLTGPALEAEHLTKTYRLGKIEVAALSDVSLTIDAAQIVCIMGRSGSGKSTLLRQLGLIDRPSAGEIRIHGRAVTSLSERERTRTRLSNLGYVFQEYALLAELTAEENVYLPALMLGKPGRDGKQRARELLERVGLAGRLRHRPRELSGGEQQRVAIARALVNEPAILFADEPTANLDTHSAATVMETLAGLNSSLGVTVVFVSHDPDDRRYATVVIDMHDGSLVVRQG